MKKVYSSSYDVMHLFAQRTQLEARNSSSNVFFKDYNIDMNSVHKVGNQILKS